MFNDSRIAANSKIQGNMTQKVKDRKNHSVFRRSTTQRHHFDDNIHINIQRSSHNTNN